MEKDKRESMKRVNCNHFILFFLYILLIAKVIIGEISHTCKKFSTIIINVRLIFFIKNMFSNM
jgi:hypothetical protein